MWDAIIKLVIGIAAALVSANFFTGGLTRSRRTLREEVDLLEHLPVELPGRELLADHVSEGLRTYIAAARIKRTDVPTLDRRSLRVRLGAFGCAVIGMAAGAVSGWGSWVEFIAAVGAYLFLAWTTALFWRMWRLGRIEAEKSALTGSPPPPAR